jgi:hypothetical protein
MSQILPPVRRVRSLLVTACCSCDVGGPFDFRSGRFAVILYSKIPSDWWTGPTGSLICSYGQSTCLLALYLSSNAYSNMAGIYRLPKPLMWHETPLSESEATQALRNLYEAAFAVYDEETQYVFLPQHAAVQMGATLSQSNNTRIKLVKLLRTIKHPFVDLFYDRYKEAYKLDGKNFSRPQLSLSKGMIEALVHRDGNCCRVCGTARDLGVDHIVALINGGRTVLENLQFLCGMDSAKKAAADRAEFWAKLKGLYPKEPEPVDPDLNQWRLFESVPAVPATPTTPTPVEDQSQTTPGPVEDRSPPSTVTATVTATAAVGVDSLNSLHRPRDQKMCRSISGDSRVQVKIGSESYPWPSAATLIKLYNEEAADELPAVEIASPERVQKAQDFIRRFPDFTFWRHVMAETKLSMKLRGLDPSREFPNFKGDFDWLLSRGRGSEVENCVRVAEGRYRDKPRRQRHPP